MYRNIGINILIVFIPITFVYLLFSFSKIEILPDYFELSKISDASSFITTLFETSVTIISITVALVILSFNTFKQKGGEYSSEYFISIKYLHYLVSLYITVIFLIFFSLIEIIKASDNTINLLYFNIYLFITTIILLVNFSYNLFKKISISDLIQYYFSIIDRKRITNTSITIPNHETLEQKTKDPLLIIEDLGINYLRRGDFVICNLIYTELTNSVIRFMKEAKDGIELNLYIEYLIKVYENFIPEAIAKNNFILLSSIWTWFTNIHNEVNVDIENDQIIKKLLSFWDCFRFFGCKYYKTLVKANQQELAEEYLEKVIQIFRYDKDYIFPHEKEMHLFSYLFIKGYNELYKECPDDNFFTGINEDWKNFIEIIQNIYYSCGEFDLKINNEIGLLSTIHQLSRNTVFDNHSSQPLKNFYIYRKFYCLIRELLDRGIDRNIFNNDMDKILIDINPLKNISWPTIKIIYENVILTDYGNLLVFLQKHNFINHSVVGGLTIGDLILSGDLGELSHHYINKNDEDSSLDCLKTIFDIINALNSGFEKDLKRNSGLQFNLNERLTYLEEELVKKNNLSEKGSRLLAEIQDLILKINISGGNLVR